MNPRYLPEVSLGLTQLPAGILRAMALKSVSMSCINVTRTWQKEVSHQLLHHV